MESENPSKDPSQSFFKVSRDEFVTLRKTLRSEHGLVLTGSMEPLIKAGEKIVVEEKEVPTLFDILVFYQDEGCSLIQKSSGARLMP